MAEPDKPPQIAFPEAVDEAGLRGSVGYNLRRVYFALHKDFVASPGDRCTGGGSRQASSFAGMAP